MKVSIIIPCYCNLYLMPSKPNKIERPWNKQRQRVEYREPRYNTRRWQKVRRVGLLKEPWCAECLKNNLYITAKIRDHIVPVSQGGEFWDTKNHQSLCATCHQIKTNREKRG